MKIPSSPFVYSFEPVVGGGRMPATTTAINYPRTGDPVMRGLGTTLLAVSLLLLPFAWAAAPASAQESPGFAGHWEGAILTPNGELGVNVDLAVDEEGVWSGDISIPVQGAEDFPLSDVTVDGSKISFRMDGVPGDPTFSGTLSEDGTTISGPFTQGGAELEFTLTHEES